MADIVKGFREAIQDLLVPELKAMRAEMSALKESVQQNAQAILELRREMNERFAAMQKEMNERFVKVDERFAEITKQIGEMRGDIGEVQGEIKVLAKISERILAELEVKERVTRLEERMDAFMAARPA